MRYYSFVMVFIMAVLLTGSAWSLPPVFPGAAWATKRPVEVGLDSARLVQIRNYLGGRGCIVRYGYMVYTWGSQSQRADVASACKPWFSTFLFKAVESGRLSSVEEKVVDYWPCLNDLNSSLGYKDRNITFRHMANQISCYGVREAPGAAYDYNDWQMALFWDALFTKVYNAAYSTVDATVLHALLTNTMQCQDNPTFMAFGTGDRPGRVGVSVRDFARLGLLYLNQGDWNGTRLLSAANAVRAVTEPLPNSIPRTAGQAAAMCSGQRTLGSSTVPDNQTDHKGSYSWLWWVNGTDRNGYKMWPDAPDDAAACLGHANGMRGMCFIPSMGIVMSWNDTRLNQYPSGPPHPLNTALDHLVQGDTGAGTGIREDAGLRKGGIDLTVFPNPFNPAVVISYGNRRGGIQTTKARNSWNTAPTLAIYNTNGRIVHRVRMESDTYVWDAAGLPSGVYVARARAGNHTTTRKLFLQR